MSFNIKKILDTLSPSYAQLKGLLIATVGSIGMVYFIGVKTANFQNAATSNAELTQKTYDMVVETKKEITKLKTENKTDITKLYTDILDMNTRNNTFWNTKFTLLINYGNGNKGLLLDMLKYQDEQQKLYEQDRLKNMEYWNSIKPPLVKPDTTDPNYNIKVDKLYNE